MGDQAVPADETAFFCIATGWTRTSICSEGSLTDATGISATICLTGRVASTIITRSKCRRCEPGTVNGAKDKQQQYSLNALAHLDVDDRYHTRLLEKLDPIANDEDRPLVGDQFEHARRVAQYLILKWTEDEYPPFYQ